MFSKLVSMSVAFVAVLFAVPALAQTVAVTPVTTIGDFLGSADMQTIGKVPYILSFIALIAVPILTEVLKQFKDMPQWVKWVVPTAISIIFGCITAAVNGFAPWSPEGINILIAVVGGGLGGQGIFVANKARMKAAEK